jgi:putative oxidoreductase
MNAKNFISWILRITTAVILLQTLYFKFTAHPDSVHIFSALGVEPWGRIGLGIIELITALLILFPTTKLLGMLISFGIIVGAVFSHLLVLGINVSNDGGMLFTLALIVLIACSAFFILHKTEYYSFTKYLKNEI